MAANSSAVGRISSSSSLSSQRLVMPISVSSVLVTVKVPSSFLDTSLA